MGTANNQGTYQGTYQGVSDEEVFSLMAASPCSHAAFSHLF
jgi:hypothetical protein